MRARLIALVTVVLVVPGVGLWAPEAEATAVIANAIYEAHVAEVGDSSVGSWNAVTAAGHPTGAGNNLLFRNMTTSTNFSSLRIFDPAGNRDYTFGGSGGGIDMDPFVFAEGPSPIGNGHRTVWDLENENLTVTQDVFVVGTNFGNSAIYHTVEVFNDSGEVDIGWRNLYDWGVDNDMGFDDGPANSIETPGGTVVGQTTNEFSHVPGADEFARVTSDPNAPTYEPLLALGFDPGFFILPVSIPTEYAYVSWPGSFGTAFDYAPGGGNVTGDSAGLSWFGRDANSAIRLGSEDSVRFTQIIFGVVPDAPPPGRTPAPATIVLLALGLAGLGSMRRFKR